MSLGYLADPLGRERTLSVVCAVFIVGAVLQAASYTVVQIVSYTFIMLVQRANTSHRPLVG